jgi:GT2 family glycosyltransferase
VSDAGSVAIVIVSYNVRDELDTCLGSVVEHTEPFPSTITVVDNGSRDGTVEMVRERWRQVRLIEAGDNLGFARASNVGIRATQSDYVLLLNPDTIVRAGSVAALVCDLESHLEAAAAGPRLIDEHGTAEWSFGWTIGPLGELRQKIIGGLYRQGLPWAVKRIERWTREAGEREWISGACILVRRVDLNAVGLLDECFFMYTEDVDLCLQLRRRGRTIRFVPEAEVVHLRGQSAGWNPRTEQLRRRSQLAYYAKHHPAWLPLLRVYLRLTGKNASAE